MAQHKWNVPPEILVRIKDAMNEKGMSGGTLALEMDMDAVNLYSYLRGDSCMNVLRFRQICEVLGVSADWILFGKK